MGQLLFWEIKTIHLALEISESHLLVGMISFVQCEWPWAKSISKEKHDCKNRV